jgi:ankyrin repeat protein
VAIHSLCVCCVAFSQLMQTKYGSTALIRACANGHLETAKLLLHRGAFVNYQDRVRVLHRIYSWEI